MVRCRFGEFDIDVGARQLVRQGRAVHLSKKAFDLLAILLREQPTVVTKEQLYQELWPETFVGDANLMVLVGEIRKALGDSAHSPQFIRTAHGVGYAFCGEARDATSDSRPKSRRPQVWLVGDQRTFALSAGDNVIGRDPNCDVWVDDASVSRRHACIRIEAESKSARLHDLQSTNGTFVGRRRVTDAATLSDGDAIKIGSVTLEFRAVGEEQPPTKRIRRKAGGAGKGGADS